MVKYTYLDNASITRMDEKVLEAMKPYFFESYAIPTSETGYSMGIEAREALEKSRGTIATAIGANEKELFSHQGVQNQVTLHSRALQWHSKIKRVIT